MITVGTALAGRPPCRSSAISEDDKVIVGSGVNPSGEDEAWMAALPRIDATPPPQTPALGPAALWVLAALLGGYGASLLSRRIGTRAQTGLGKIPASRSGQILPESSD